MEFETMLFALCTLGYLFAAFYKFRYSIAVLPALFPLYLWKTQVLGLPLTFVDVVILLAFVVWVLKLFLKRFKEYWDRDFWIEWGWWLFALLLMSITSVYTASQTGFLILPYEGKEFASLQVALGILKSWIMVPVLFFVLWKNVLNNEWYRRFSWNAYLVSALVLVVWALWQVWSGDYLTVDGRASGPFISANYLSLYIGPAVLGLGLEVWEAIVKRQKRNIVLYVCLFLMCFAALSASRSYASFLAVLAGFAFYALFALRAWRRILPIFVVLLLLGAVFIFFQKDTEKFKTFFDFDHRSSSAVRLQTWTVSWHLVQDNWITGIGLGQFEAQYQLKAAEVLGKEPYEVTQLHPHNIFLSFWLNLGVFGFLVFCGLIYKVLKLRNTSNLLYLSLFVMLLVHGLFDQPFWKNDLSLLWWMLIAFL